MWGWNESGQLGLPSRSLRKALPQQSSPKAGKVYSHWLLILIRCNVLIRYSITYSFYTLLCCVPIKVCFFNTNCECVINRIGQEHRPPKRRKTEENPRRCSYRSRLSQHCWMFLHHVRSRLSAAAPVTQPQLRVRNLHLQPLFHADIVVFF